ncbi:MAG: hypothetical protein C0490_05080 [Marivirga sp.]|nr:hypothetical protein [Marivirga sp.]
MKNKQDIEISDELIAKYLAGEASPEEAEALHDWLSVQGNLTYFEGFQRTWNSTGPSKTSIHVPTEKAWEDLSNKADHLRIPSRSPFRLSPSFLKIAASLLILFTGSIFLYYFLKEEQPIAEITILTNENAKSVTLPDSSKVVLYRHSAISYSESFGHPHREVNFSGEGFFRVEGNAGKPFVIHTSLADIKVVGTVFNVSLTTDQLDVGVEEGKVIVLSKTDSAHIQSGHAASVRSTMRAIEVKNTIDINNWAYATRKFSFQDTPLEQVFQQIEKAYPYKIEIKNQDIKNCKLTTTFDQVSAREILNLIGETLDLTVQENDSTFHIDGKGCPWDQ